MSEVFTSASGDVWIQKKPGQAAEWLGTCTDAGDLAEPQGDITKIQCRDRNGAYETVGETQAAPGPVTINIKRLLFNDNTILDEIKRCGVNVYLLLRTCGQAGVFGQWAKAFVLKNARATTKTYAGLAAREDAESSVAFDFSADNPLITPRQVEVRRESIAETTDINDIVFCNAEQCEGDCGPEKDAGTEGYVVTDAPGGSPASKADVWQTEDSGTTWADVAGPHPFGAGEDVLSNTCFPMDANTTRWMVARESSGADFAEIAYSDDKGDTWTQVTVGSVAGEGAAGEGALFSIDRDHIWFCTTSGNVYFSEDAGVTWTLQSSAATADGGVQLNVIKFASYDDGWAVGNTDIVLRTTDGGDTWEALTSPTSSDNVTSLEVFSKNRAMIGSNADGLFHSDDAGVTWAAKTFTGQGTTGTVKFLEFANPLCGIMGHNPAAGQGYVHRTIDGGHVWQRLTTPTNLGLNAGAAIDENHYFVVGNAQGGTGFVAKISP